MSSSAVVEVDPAEAIGTSFLDYVIPSQRKQIEQQITLAKSGNAMARLRFGWMVPGQEWQTRIKKGDHKGDDEEEPAGNTEISGIRKQEVAEEKNALVAVAAVLKEGSTKTWKWMWSWNAPTVWLTAKEFCGALPMASCAL